MSLKVFIPNLPEGWEILPFGKVLDGGTRNGIYKSKEFHGSGVNIVNMGELFAHPRLFPVEMQRVQLNAKEMDIFLLQPGDLLFARRSLVAEGAGRCSVVCELDEATTFESSIIRARPLKSAADGLFLYYLFSSTLGRYLIGTLLRQTSVSGITGTDLIKLEIPVPPPDEQRAIARILGTLDDKIDLNRQMNRTLEALALALFKSWFVDFDPVAAKAAGRKPYGMNEANAALFPDRFAESALGAIPEGWGVSSIEKIIEVSRAGVNPADYPSEIFAHFSIPAFDEGQRPALEAGNTIKSNKFVVPESSVLLSKLNPQTPRVWMPDLDSSYKSIASTEFIICKPLLPFTVEYLFCLFQEPAFQGDFASLVTGTSSSHQRVKPTDFVLMKIISPKAEVVKAFAKLAKPVFSEVAELRRQSQTLATVRDALLPKLLSGEIKVREAEREMEQVV